MPIIYISTGEVGQVGEAPRRPKLVTTDSLSVITTAGYLNNSNTSSKPIYPTDVIDVIYSYSTASGAGTYGTFIPSFSSGVITLNAWVDSGNVLLPVVAGDFAVFNGTSGQIKDAGYLPSNAAKTNVVMANGATIANHIATYTDTAGTIGEDAATAINGGNIQAGLSGTAGQLASFPGTAANGSFIFKAINNTGNFVSTVSNSNIGQATVYSLPDTGTATAGILSNGAALVSGNLIKASGTAGQVADQGFAMKSVAGAAAAGGAAAQSFTDAFCTSGSNVIGNWNTQANAASVLKIVPGNGSFVVTSSADAGVGTFNYIITK